MIQNVYSGSRIPDLNFFHPGPRFQGSKKHHIPDPVQQQRLKVFLTQKVDTKLSEIHMIQDVYSGFRIPDLDFFHPGSQGQKVEKAPDPGSATVI
jgi:hypothetical protein